MPISLIENRTIRVFISSTFSDMNDERTELMKKTFPRLRVMAANRDVTLTEVDLRWGITKEESESGKVVDICLREIQNSIPFFIGIIGNRYGWVPSRGDIEESTFDRFDQVRSYVERKLSVTDMEMQFGVLEHKEDLHAFFYINDNKEERDNNPEKLAELKRAVRSNGRYPVFDFTSPEDLAKQVEDAFVRLLDELFPEKHSLSFLEKERISQRSFLNQLCQSYVPVKENFEKLDNFLSDENQQYLIVTGESGLGKSALVANWVKRLLDKKQTNRKIIYHFIGNGGSLGSHHHVVKTLCADLKDQFKLEPPFDERDKEKWSKEDTDTLELIYNQISVDKEGCLIVLDAVNQLVDNRQGIVLPSKSWIEKRNHYDKDAKDMLWLGNPPKNIKLIITTLDEDPTMEVFKQHEYNVFELHPLGFEQRRTLVGDYLINNYGKHLTDEQVTAIINNEQCSNTLVLKTLLDELASSGSYDNLEERIHYYLAPKSIPDFYQRVLERFEDDFGEEMVSHVLSLILLSRSGVPEGAITWIAQLKPLQWSQLYCGLISHLNIKMGLVSFSHRFFSEAVQQRYLSSNNNFVQMIRGEIVEYCRSQETDTAYSWLELGHQYSELGIYNSLYSLLMREDTFRFFYGNYKEDLIWWWNLLLSDSSDKYHLEDYLSTIKKFGFIKVLISFVSDFGFSSVRLADSYYRTGRMYLESRDNSNALFYYDKAYYLFKSAYIYSNSDEEESSFGIGRENWKINEAARRGLEYTFRGVHHLRMRYLKQGNHKMALELAKIGLTIELLIYGEDTIMATSCYDTVGYEYGKVGDKEKALESRLKALEIATRISDEDWIATLFNRVGQSYLALGNIDAANDYFRRSAEKWKELGNEEQAQKSLSEIVENK